MSTQAIIEESEYAVFQMPTRTPEIVTCPPQNSTANLFLKRAFDILFSVGALIFFSPVFFVIFTLIKIFSPNGPVLFSHKRVGQNGQYFKCFKFRTMVPNAEKVLEKMLAQDEALRAEFMKDFKLKHDPRIIPVIGHFLRKSSLDELPQFLNVLFGDMSVVGPRPIITEEMMKYGKHIIKVLSVKPGITGLWQVSGRNNINYQTRVVMDLCYIRKQNLLLDVHIVFKTVLVMLTRQGAY